MSSDRVMLLIDADNVSVDVMEQALRLLLNQHGAVHVRRAYCTAESAVKHQTFFKQMSIKPMVNLAAGKNSTDIALAVDAIDLVLAERPDVVVIASSDSDFAPLVQRLREKGCVVRGIGQQGKTGDETLSVYDDYTVLEHHKAAPAPTAARKASASKRAAPVKKAAVAKKAAPAKRALAAKKAPAAKKASRPRKVDALDLPVAAELAPASAPHTGAPDDAASAPAMPKPAALPTSSEPDERPRRSTSRSARAAAAQTSGGADAHAGRGANGRASAGASLAAVLACLPELQAGHSLALNVAAQRLREAHLLSKSSSSLKLFAQLSDRFDLLPAGKPSQVRLRD